VASLLVPGLMAGLEGYIDPLLRPPLVLSVVAAGLKCLATGLVFQEPLLVARGEYLRRRSRLSASAAHGCWLVVQVAFVGLAVATFRADLAVIASGFSRLSFWERGHLFALVLAFSPNTVGAAAICCIVLVKVAWQKGEADVARLCKLSDALGYLFAAALALFYLLPLVLIVPTYGVLGTCVVAVVFVWDLCTLPWRLITWSMRIIWVALPVTFAFAVCHLVVCALWLGHIWLFERANPQLADRVRLEGTRVQPMQLKLPDRFPSRIIGVARDLVQPGGDLENAREMGVLTNLTEDHGHAEANEKLAPGESSADKCILNDQLTVSVTSLKVAVCAFLPLLQLTVVVAAKLLLGAGFFGAAEDTFAERSWSHFAGHVRDQGYAALVPLLEYCF